MAYRNIAVRFTADTAQYSAATRAAAADTKALGDSSTVAASKIAADAQANIAAAVRRRESLQGLASEYRKVSEAASAGSTEQIAAERLAASAAKRLGDVGTSASVAQRELGVLRRGFTELGSTALAQTTGIASGLEGLTKEFSLVKIGAGAAVAGVGLGLAKMAADGVQHFVSLTSEIRAFQRVAGGSAEDSSKLVFALHELGVEPASVERGFLSLSQEIEKGGAKLDKWGVSVARNKDGSADIVGTLLNVSDAYNNLTSQTDKNQLAIDLFTKRAATNLLPILAYGREGLKGLTSEAAKLGLVFNQEELNQGRELGIQMNEAKHAVEGLEIQIGKGLVPALSQSLGIITDIAKGLNDIHVPGTDKGLVSTFLQSTTDPLAVPRAASSLLPKGVRDELPDWLKAAGDSGDKAARAAQDVKDLNTAMQQNAVVAEASAAALLKLPDAQQRVSDTERGLADSQEKLSDLQRRGAVDQQKLADAQVQSETAAHGLITANESLTSAQDKLNQLLAAGPVNARDVASAQERLETTSQSLTAAQDKLAAAQAHLNDVMKGASAEDLGKGQLSEEQATLGLATAKQRVADAQASLTQAYKSGDANQIADASNNLKSAQLGVRSATFGLTDAQKALNDLQQQGKAGSKDLADAQKQVQVARRDEEKATDAQAKAQEDLRTAQAGDPQFADNVAMAERGVRDARWGVEAATRAVDKAAENLRAAQAGDPDFQDKLAAAHHNVETAVRAVVQARIDEAIVEDTIASGSAPSNRQQLQLTIEKWEQLRDTLAPGDPLRVNLDAIIATLREHLSLNIDTTQANANLNNVALRAIAIRQAAEAPGPLSPDQAQQVRDYINAQPHARGGFLFHRTLIEAGEAGPELILPLSDRARTMELLGQAGLAVSDSWNKMQLFSHQPSSPLGAAFQAYGRAGIGSTHESVSRSEQVAQITVIGNDAQQARTLRHEQEWLYATRPSPVPVR